MKEMNAGWHFRVSGEKRKVLLVEDEIINQQMMMAILGDVYDVIVASSGERAIEILKERHDTLSIVLLDLNLPGMGGIQVLSLMKDNSAYSNLPVIVMTADSASEVECLNLGAIDFIPKPYPQPDVILARIRRTIELSENRDTLKWTERDLLTGLYNRDFFFHYAVQLDLFHKDAPIDAIVVDINNFHTVNDRLGRERGDEILRSIARKAQEFAEGTGGIACRSGADTFMIYCPHIDDYRKLLKKLSEGEDGIRLRMGVYPDVDKAVEIDRRFDRAKTASDSVRGSISKPIAFYDDSIRKSELLAEQLINDFPKALEEHQLTVFYQPKFNVRKEKPVLSSAEALVRWKHPEMGMVSPGVFIPLFEKNGLIQDVDFYVWNETAAQIRRWRDTYGVTIPVSVNVSRIDIQDPALSDKLLKIVEDNGLRPEDLLLEITESAYIEDSEKIVEKVSSLRGLGFRIEMDDFGSGYSSLSMLGSLAIDALKLDMQFVRSAFKGKKDTRLLEAMIRLAGTFEVLTIAEGVETEDQFLALKEMGCDVIQGYYFSRPLPADEFENFLKEGR